AEQVIYLVKVSDVRHVSYDVVKQKVEGKN
ncbi:MAG: phosphate transport system regulator PhoU, partial [Moraxellaceae bacterium]|nr:phosphate transport system regulator PhoU [Moraxellaceae bacterium]